MSYLHPCTKELSRLPPQRPPLRVSVLLQLEFLFPRPKLSCHSIYGSSSFPAQSCLSTRSTGVPLSPPKVVFPLDLREFLFPRPKLSFHSIYGSSSFPAQSCLSTRSSGVPLSPPKVVFPFDLRKFLFPRPKLSFHSVYGSSSFPAQSCLSTRSTGVPLSPPKVVFPLDLREFLFPRPKLSFHSIYGSSSFPAQSCLSIRSTGVPLSPPKVVFPLGLREFLFPHPKLSFHSVHGSSSFPVYSWSIRSVYGSSPLLSMVSSTPSTTVPILHPEEFPYPQRVEFSLFISSATSHKGFRSTSIGVPLSPPKVVFPLGLQEFLFPRPKLSFHLIYGSSSFPAQSCLSTRSTGVPLSPFIAGLPTLSVGVSHCCPWCLPLRLRQFPFTIYKGSFLVQEECSSRLHLISNPS
ncbi:uncharacterized protein LOC117315510 isoform X2 [Pecten maximus]|uniref:uncharacterized protein LOC117315510 isoform X2 n=1 Tax=Pecten maximus TaxID=6579 RepID=UPI0014580BD2|nr:uncharacterized protein LOC117315510 isoform X2 [Pecten maximus]